MLILAYHSIHPGRRDALAVHPREFIRQITWLRQRHSIVPLEEIRAAYTAGLDTSTLASITFDDGLRDNYEHLFPILRELHIPATIFVVTGLVGTDHAFTGENFGKNASIDTRDTLSMTWEHIREMHQAGVTFGSHSATHRRLSRITEEDVRAELCDSKAKLEEQLQCPVSQFCYPFGDLNEGTIRAVEAAGYTCAVVTPNRNLPPENVFMLRRVGVYCHNSIAALRLKTSNLARRAQASRWRWKAALSG